MDAVPEGMTFDEETRTLSGTPGEAAAGYACTVIDEDGDEAGQVVGVTVEAAG